MSCQPSQRQASWTHSQSMRFGTAMPRLCRVGVEASSAVWCWTGHAVQPHRCRVPAPCSPRTDAAARTLFGHYMLSPRETSAGELDGELDGKPSRCAPAPVWIWGGGPGWRESLLLPQGFLNEGLSLRASVAQRRGCMGSMTRHTSVFLGGWETVPPTIRREVRGHTLASLQGSGSTQQAIRPEGEGCPPKRGRSRHGDSRAAATAPAWDCVVGQA